MKAIHLLCSLSPSWDTFYTAISNSAPNGTLVYNDVSSAIIGEEICHKSMSGKMGKLTMCRRTSREVVILLVSLTRKIRMRLRAVLSLVATTKYSVLIVTSQVI